MRVCLKEVNTFILKRYPFDTCMISIVVKNVGKVHVWIIMRVQSHIVYQKTKIKSLDVVSLTSSRQ